MQQHKMNEGIRGQTRTAVIYEAARTQADERGTGQATVGEGYREAFAKAYRRRSEGKRTLPPLPDVQPDHATDNPSELVVRKVRDGEERRGNGHGENGERAAEPARDKHGDRRRVLPGSQDDQDNALLESGNGRGNGRVVLRLQETVALPERPRDLNVKLSGDWLEALRYRQGLMHK